MDNHGYPKNFYQMLKSLDEGILGHQTFAVSYICMDLAIEDEYHAFFTCPKVDTQRETYLKPRYRQGDGRPEFSDSCKIRNLTL